MKYLLLALVIFVIAGWLVRSKKPPAARQAPRGESRSASHPAGQGARHDAIEDIVECAHCHTHFPASEAVAGADGALYCSRAHQRLGHGGS